jgi:hypothetical protein
MVWLETKNAVVAYFDQRLNIQYTMANLCFLATDFDHSYQYRGTAFLGENRHRLPVQLEQVALLESLQPGWKNKDTVQLIKEKLEIEDRIQAGICTCPPPLSFQACHSDCHSQNPAY